MACSVMASSDGGGVEGGCRGRIRRPGLLDGCDASVIVPSSHRITSRLYQVSTTFLIRSARCPVLVCSWLSALCHPGSTSWCAAPISYGRLHKSKSRSRYRPSLRRCLPLSSHHATLPSPQSTPLSRLLSIIYHLPIAYHICLRAC